MLLVSVFYYMVIVLIISLILGYFIYSMVKNTDADPALPPMA